MSESSSDESAAKERKKKKKKEEKKAKKQQKKLKKEKKKREAADKPPQSPVSPPSSHQAEVAVTKTTDVANFFSQLRQQEVAKGSVGTVHASGTKATGGTLTAITDDWECVKRGCGAKNSKYAPACNKCGSMKRMSEWR